LKTAGLVLIAILCIIGIMSLITVEESVIVYDCRMVEFYPNVPNNIKEECRKLIKDNTPRYTI